MNPDEVFFAPGPSSANAAVAVPDCLENYEKSESEAMPNPQPGSSKGRKRKFTAVKDGLREAIKKRMETKLENGDENVEQLRFNSANGNNGSNGSPSCPQDLPPRRWLPCVDCGMECGPVCMKPVISDDEEFDLCYCREEGCTGCWSPCLICRDRRCGPACRVGANREELYLVVTADDVQEPRENFI